MGAFKGLLAGGFLGIAGCVAHADEFDVTKKPVGSVTRWQAHNGNTQVKYVGEKRGLFKLQFKRDASKGAPLRGIFWANRNGELVRSRIGNVVEEFSPHDCSRTRGECQYVQTNSRLGKRLVLSKISVRNDVWYFSRFALVGKDWVLFEEGQFTTDEAGYDIDAKSKVYDKGELVEETWGRRIE